MLAGAVFAPFLLLVRRVRDRAGVFNAYHWLRNFLGSSILLGLELLVAADIVRTVSSEPTLRGVLVLGLIVLIRTFLSFTLELELRNARLGHNLPPPSEDYKSSRNVPASPRSTPNEAGKR